MKQFEYDMLRVIERRHDYYEYVFKGIRFCNEFYDVLNHLGEDGWQLVGKRLGNWVMMREVVQNDSDN